MNIPDQFTAPFHASANRPHLLMGCEPVPLMVLATICLIGLFAFLSPFVGWGILGSIGLFFFGRLVLAEFARTEPCLYMVYDQSMRYRQGHYPAKPSLPHRWRR